MSLDGNQRKETGELGFSGSPDREMDWLAHVAPMTIPATMISTPILLTNFYVSLKSKPLVLLVGPEKNRSKETFVERFATAWVEESVQFQKMTGHAWWAAGSEAVCMLSTTQARFNAEKFFAVLEEACQPENQGRVFFICLEEISPAELLTYFSSLSFQAYPGEMIFQPDTPLTNSIPYPPNLFVAGTMSSERFLGYDSDLLRYTTVIHSPEIDPLPSNRFSHPFPLLEGQKTLLHRYIRDENTACAKLRQLPGWHSHLLKPAIEVIGLLLRHGVPVHTRAVTSEMLIYLANSWSALGTGLFDLSFMQNLTIALDLAIAQFILPHGWTKLASPCALRRDVETLLGDRFPSSQAFLNQVA